MAIGKALKWTERPFHSPVQVVISFLLLTFVACFYLTGHADLKDEPWLTKDWTQWTSKDCGQVLRYSPWTQTTNPPYGSNVRYVQLRSALPIRQALLRQIQLENHYDKMDAQKKQAFDQAHLHDLDPTDQIIIFIQNSAVTYEAPGNSGQRTIFVDPDPGVQIALKVADRAFVTPIQTNKVKYESNSYYERLNQFEYIFPRTVDGKPRSPQPAHFRP